MKWLAVFVGGGLGSMLRFALSSWLAPITGVFPWATLAANTLAAGIIAWLLWQLAAIGFCGGLSTFSTFSMETVQLLRSGQTSLALIYMVVSVLLSVLLFYFIAQWFQRV
jgi:CrcB protein